LLSGVFFLQKGCGLQADESPVTSERAGKIESGEAVVFKDKMMARDRRRSAELTRTPPVFFPSGDSENAL
jgi:hypothetical protein